MISIPTLSSNRLNESNATIVHPLNTVTLWLWITGPPLILLAGTFGSIMILLIFHKIKSGTSTAFFTTLAVVDLISLHTDLLNLWLKSAFNVAIDTLTSTSCKLFFYSMHLAGMLSAWLIVLVTVQRALSVIWPHRVSIVCSKKNSKFFLLVLILLLVLLHGHMLYGIELISDSTFSLCEYTIEEYGAFFDIVWTWVDLVISSLLPSFILLVSNCVLVWSLTKLKARHLTGGQSEQMANRKKQTSSITVTLIAVSVAFFVLTNPFNIFMICLPYVIDRYDSDSEVRAWVDFLFLLVNLLWYGNCASNFYIYCLTGSKFRCEAKRILFQCRKNSPSDAILSVQQMTEKRVIFTDRV